jgi:hypothetical protein
MKPKLSKTKKNNNGIGLLDGDINRTRFKLNNEKQPWSVGLGHRHKPHISEAKLRKKNHLHLETTSRSSHCTASAPDDKDIITKTPLSPLCAIVSDDDSHRSSLLPSRTSCCRSLQSVQPSCNRIRLHRHRASNH